MFKVLATGLLFFAFATSTVHAQVTQQVEPSLQDLHQQLQQQAAEIENLRQRLDDSAATGMYLDESPSPDCTTNPHVRRLPLVAEAGPPDCGSAPADAHVLTHYATYDRGFWLRPFNKKKHPFELRTTGWIQVRHHGFARDVTSWTDSAGVTRPVVNRNAFDIERARLVFAGTAIDERSTFFLQLDGDTDNSHTVDFFDYFWAWRFSEDFQLQLGKRIVPGARQWLLGAPRTRFTDFPMASDFFRPDRTVGLFGVGKWGDSAHYIVMAGNGYSTTNLPNARTDNRMTFAATNYYEPLGAFGKFITDYEPSETPLVRFGHSMVYSPQSDGVTGTTDELQFLRLSDGTRATQTGALAPGATVSQFDIYLYGLDAAIRYQGFSVNAEIFMRWVENIQADAPLPVNNLFQHGFYVEGGHFVIEKKLDVNVRYSQVSGSAGDASEFAVGLNWYPIDSRQMKVSFDITHLDGSPLQSTPSDILVGDDGLLFRTQYQVAF